MTLDWYPAIRECCAHWPKAVMLHQTFEALEMSFEKDNDADRLREVHRRGRLPRHHR
jgi:hypothetical protein